MRWSDERYVRVYTRDTGEWLALGWEAQALFLFALRKADRAGIVQTGKARARGLAGMTGMPLDVVERVLPLLLEDGCLRESAGGYIIPNFIAAQETPSSDAQRKRDQRERDRDKAVAEGSTGSRAGLDAETTMSRRRVTSECHSGMSRPDVTQDGHAMRSHEVTSGHAGTVTPNRAVPCRAEPFSASQGAADAGQQPEETSPTRPPLVLEPSPSDAPPEEPKKRPKPAKAAAGDPRHAPLVDDLCEAAPGYAFLGGRDAKAVSRLLDLADALPGTSGHAAPPEVVRRWRIARAWQGFPLCRHLGDLADNWNAYAAPQRPQRGRMDTTPSDFKHLPEGGIDLGEYTPGEPS